MENNIEAKKIPNCITKEHLVKLYHPMPAKYILEAINEIIIINRKKMPVFNDKTDYQLKKAKYVFREEFIALTQQQHIGLPDGYEI